MNRQEVSLLLAKASAYNGLKPDDMRVDAFHEQLAGFTYAETVEALKEYYSQARDLVQPGHLRSIMLANRKRREEDEARRAQRTHGNQHWRECGFDGCDCTHTACCKAFLDETIEVEEDDGYRHKVAQRCDRCELWRPAHD